MVPVLRVAIGVHVVSGLAVDNMVVGQMALSKMAVSVMVVGRRAVYAADHGGCVGGFRLGTPNEQKRKIKTPKNSHQVVTFDVQKIRLYSVNREIIAASSMQLSLTKLLSTC